METFGGMYSARIDQLATHTKSGVLTPIQITVYVGHIRYQITVNTSYYISTVPYYRSQVTSTE